MIAEIKWDALGELLYVAPVTAVGVSIIYSLVILGVARAGEARREGAAGMAAIHGTMAAVAAAAFLTALVAAIYVIVEG